MIKKFDFKDITLVPEILSSISSRSEIDIYTDEGRLPLIVSPMDTVIDTYNSGMFRQFGFEVCYPRNVEPYYLGFKSISLDDFERIIESKTLVTTKILVDIANGHIKKLWETAKAFKQKWGDTKKLMVGNIANPETYRRYCDIGVDYIRVGIGGGCFVPDSPVLTDKGYKNISDIEIGDFVWLFNPVRHVGAHSSFKSFWKGPFSVIEKKSPVIFKIQRVEKPEDIQTVDVSRLKPCFL